MFKFRIGTYASLYYLGERALDLTKVFTIEPFSILKITDKSSAMIFLADIPILYSSASIGPDLLFHPRLSNDIKSRPNGGSITPNTPLKFSDNFIVGHYCTNAVPNPSIAFSHPTDHSKLKAMCYNYGLYDLAHLQHTIANYLIWVFRIFCITRA